MIVFETTMYDYDKDSLENRIKEKINQGWKVKGNIFKKKVNLHAVITYGVKISKED